MKLRLLVRSYFTLKCCGLIPGEDVTELYTTQKDWGPALAKRPSLMVSDIRADWIGMPTSLLSVSLSLLCHEGVKLEDP